MQTILGATGQIAVELARKLARSHTSDLRLVSRTPRKVNDTDVLAPADLLNAQQAADAVKGSSIVYFTAGLPPDTELWETQFPEMLKNALAAITTAARIAQTAVDKANINIVNLFDEAQRTTAAAGRDASLAEYRKLAADIDALNKQIADLEAGASKAEGPKKQ